MTKTMDFAKASKTNQSNESIQAVIDDLVYNKLDGVLNKRVDWVIWLKEYVPLADIAREESAIDIHGQLVSEKLKTAHGYVRGYDYIKCENQSDLPPKAFADTALVRTVEALSNRAPVHQRSIMPCIEEFIGASRERGELMRLDL